VPSSLVKERPAGGGRGRPPVPGYGRNGDATPPVPEAPAVTTALVGLGAFLAAVAMLFVAFTSAYLARRQEPGWPTIILPGIVWANTAVLLLSSGTFEWARALLRRGDRLGLRRGLGGTAALGAVFVLGQVQAWRELAARGIFLASSPHSAFFYLLTGVHGLHLLGGMAALGVVLARARQNRYTPREHAGVTLCALYWHFMDGLWLYLFVLLTWA
jgi:cytochrome c oxidase subunit III